VFDNKSLDDVLQYALILHEQKRSHDEAYTAYQRRGSDDEYEYYDWDYDGEYHIKKLEEAKRGFGLALSNFVRREIIDALEGLKEKP
jgi:hypothetical protein